MLNLLVKDLKMLFFSDKVSIGRRILSIVFSLLMIGILITIETFLFILIINKVKVYGNMATRSIVIIFMFVISILMILVNVFQSIKLFFNEKDVEQLIKHPVTNEQIIISKLVFLLITHYFTSAMFIFPLFIAYGSIMGRTPIYYYEMLFYPLLTFLLEAGVALFLVYPVKLLLDFLKKHMIVQFILAVLIMFGLSYLYSVVLETFMDLVVNNQLALIFTDDSIKELNVLANNLIPISFIVTTFLGGESNLLIFISISSGVFLIGLIVAVIAFNFFRGFRFHAKESKKIKDLKVTGVKRTLLKKELIILFKNSNNIFSFTGLLIVQPFLMYLVINALNGVFTSGTFSYYIAVLPNFVILLDVVLIMLFTLIINSGANNYIAAERSTMRILKTIPVSIFTQMFIKVAVPLFASIISLVISTTVLYVTETITLQTYLFSTLLTIVLLVVFEIVSLKEELKIRMNKPRSTFLSSFYSYLLPIAFLLVTLYASYSKINIVYAYLIGLGTVILLGLPMVINLKSKVVNDFIDLEMVN